MAARYGAIHRVTNFIERIIPKRGSGSFQGLFVHKVVVFLQQLDALQDENAHITLVVHTNDGIWVVFGGLRLCLILPSQAHLRLLIVNHQGPETKSLISFAQNQGKSGNFSKITAKSDWSQWRVKSDGLQPLTDYLKTFPKPGKSDFQKIGENHPRFFPGAIREAALTAFESSGRRCPGTGRGRKPHIVKADERIEYDHILPWSKGGSRTLQNIQVLCEACNRMKGATAA